MKKTVRLILAAIFLWWVPNVAAIPLYDGMQVALYVTDADRGTNGGPFDVHLWDNGQGDFLFTSYCVEMNEYISLNTPFYAFFDDAAYAGGVGGGSPDPLGEEAAWVYWTWQGGNPDNWAVDDVQRAIWRFEEEYAFPENDPYSAALSAPSAALTQALAESQVMNLYADNDRTGFRQSQIAPVPEPSTLLLLGVGLIGLASIKRKNVSGKG